MLSRIAHLADLHGDISLFLFGSARSHSSPNDIDLLAIYEDDASVARLRASIDADRGSPPFHLLAMTPGEEHELDFISASGAIDWRLLDIEERTIGVDGA